MRKIKSNIVGNSDFSKLAMEHVGVCDVKLFYGNSWLDLEFEINSDLNNISMTVENIESNNFSKTLSNDDCMEINGVKFNDIESFNKTIVSVLCSIFSEESCELDGFEFYGFKIA